jgi:hypothetical protein
MSRFNRLNKMSDRGKIRKEVGRLHLAVLVVKRGRVCEICGQEAGPDDTFARFHIRTVAAAPRLEFADENVLVYIKSHWWVCHEPYHHDRDSAQGLKIMEAIKRLRGENYLGDLMDIERYMSQHSGIYLKARLAELKDELSNP